MIRKLTNFGIFLFSLIVLLTCSVLDGFAANLYIRAGAAGNSSGSDWVNAYTTLPSTLVRGNTYYIADGSYGAYTFDDNESGTTLITIKKATVSDHGTDTGWQASYGDGEAVFSSSGTTWSFTRGYYTIDGQTGSGRNPGGYGFRVYSTASRASSATLVNASGVNNLTVRHVEFDWNNGTGTSTSACTKTWGSWAASSNITFSYCYFHHSSGYVFYVGMYGGGTPQRNYVIEHSYFYMIGGGGGPSAHWEMIWSTEPDNWDFRYNTVENVYGSVDAQTGWYMIGTGSNIRIYGNLFFCSNPSYCAVGGNGVIATWSNDVYRNSNIYIYNNTFAKISGGYGPRINFTHNSADDTNVVLRNNLYYNSSWAWAGIDTHSNEACGGGQSCAGTSQQTGITTTKFVNYTGNDFHLASATNAGNSLSSPYNVDPDGSIRGADGIWDRGAFEYSPNGPPAAAPSSPTNLRIQ